MEKSSGEISPTAISNVQVVIGWNFANAAKQTLLAHLSGEEIRRRISRQCGWRLSWPMRRDTHAIVHPALNILPPILPTTSCHPSCPKIPALKQNMVQRSRRRGEGRPSFTCGLVGTIMNHHSTPDTFQAVVGDQSKCCQCVAQTHPQMAPSDPIKACLLAEPP